LNKSWFFFIFIAIGDEFHHLCFIFY
jgi:hypothetical protein